MTGQQYHRIWDRMALLWSKMEDKNYVIKGAASEITITRDAIAEFRTAAHEQRDPEMGWEITMKVTNLLYYHIQHGLIK